MGGRKEGGSIKEFSLASSRGRSRGREGKEKMGGKTERVRDKKKWEGRQKE